MPDDLIDDEPEAIDPETAAKNEVRDLRKQAKRAAELEAELNGLKKKDVFRDAKVDMTTPVGQLLFDTWSGPMETEAIRTRAEELGCLESSTPAPAVERAGPTDDERRSTDERANLHAGGEPELGTQANPDPRDQAAKVAHDTITAGRSEADALAAGVRTMFEAAVAGDPRASWNPSRRS